MICTFNAETHTYTIDGAEVPSITQVLPYNFHGNASDDTRDKGHLVHRLCYLHNMGYAEEDILCDAEILPHLGNDTIFRYLDGFLKFRATHNLNGIIEIKTGAKNPCTELQLAAQALLVNEGICDDGKKAEQTFEVPLYHPVYRYGGTPDIVSVEYDLQDKVRQPYPLYALHLSEDGKFKLTEHSKNLRKNIQVFLSFLTTFKWKKERNL